MSGCRIGRVKFKSGCELRVLPGGDPTAIEAWFGHAYRSVLNADMELGGFAVVAWPKGPMDKCMVFLRNASPYMPASYLPSWVSEVVRRELISTNIAIDYGLANSARGDEAPDPAE